MSRPVKISFGIVAAILVVAATIVCALRWNAWFGNQPEQQYSVSSKPHNIVLSYGENAESSRIVSWRCDTALSLSSVQLLNWANRDTVSFQAEGSIVKSRAGRAAFYRAYIDSVPSGNYSYRCVTDGKHSDWYPLYFSDRHSHDRMQRFVVFGDIQDKEGSASAALFKSAFDLPGLRHTAPTAMVFAGDIIERPTDKYWQIFFSSLADRQTTVPIIAATGNHEYLKGVRKTLDQRWTHVFGNPHNGPERFFGTTYFVDFPYCRLIVLDTDALQVVSDYTVMQTWLRKVISQKADLWKIVVMHHPVYSAGKNRNNASMRMAFRRILEEADVVFCGHEHNYMRGTIDGDKPVYILTNSSDKFYAPKENIKADSYASYMRFYEDMKVYKDSLRIDTWAADGDTIFDSVVLQK